MAKKRKNRNIAKTSFTEANLPHTRPQVFSAVLRNRFWFVMKIACLILLFCLPLILWNTYVGQCIRYNSSMIEEDGALLSANYNYAAFGALISIPLFVIAGLGFGGGIHVYQKLVWDEMVFTSDFFAPFKKNFWKYMLIGLSLGVSFGIAQLVFYGVPLLGQGFFVNALLYGVGAIQLVFGITFAFYLYLQNEYYTLNFFNMISNALKLCFKTFLPSLGFVVIMLLPSLVKITNNLAIDFLFLVFFVPFIGIGLLGYILNGDYYFDLLINKDNFPSIYDRGVYRSHE